MTETTRRLNLCKPPIYNYDQQQKDTPNLYVNPAATTDEATAAATAATVERFKQRSGGTIECSTPRSGCWRVRTL